MSAISGVIDRDLGPDAVRSFIAAMNRAQALRGPEKENVFCDGRIGFGHRGDTAAFSRQGDTVLFNEMRSVVAVVDGEFFNAPAYRSELQARGHVFSTMHGAEILVHLFEDEGIGCIRKLDGMFAFAVYDGRYDMLYLGRDTLGKKPLFYHWENRALSFASTLAGLRRAPYFSEELDREAISDFLSFGYIPHPQTIYRRTKKLAPAHYLCFSPQEGKVEIFRYRKIDFSKKTSLSFSEAAAELRRRFEHAVQVRLETDVPLGIFLSGGIDSFLVAATAAKLLKNAPCDVFTIGFPERGYDESAAAVANFSRLKKINPRLRHHVGIVDPEIFKLVDLCASHYGEPFADASMIPMHLLVRIAGKKVRCALSGDGADELFGGYDRYRAIALAKKFSMFPPAVRQAALLLADHFPVGMERTFSGRIHRFFDGLAPSMRRTYYNWLDRAPQEKRRLLYGHRNIADPYRFFSTFIPTGTGAEAVSELDIETYLPDDALTKVDGAAMHYDLEVRSPFLDDGVVDFAAALPWHWKIDGSARKKILKSAFADLLPSNLAVSRKRGFGVPVALWMRSAWKNFVGEELLHGALSRTGIVDFFGVRRLWSEHLAQEADHSYILWHLLILSLFLGRK